MIVVDNSLVRWAVTSPDGIPISCCDVWHTEENARAALNEWVQNYRVMQGYYSTAQWERIPWRELADRCEVFSFEVGDDTAEMLSFMMHGEDIV